MDKDEIAPEAEEQGPSANRVELDSTRGGGFASVLAAAVDGPVLNAVLYPLSPANVPVRVTYEWADSALNCDPNDTTDFNFTLAKQSDGTVTLSPRDPYQGMTLFVAGTIGQGALQVQNPDGIWLDSPTYACPYTVASNYGAHIVYFRSPPWYNPYCIVNVISFLIQGDGHSGYPLWTSEYGTWNLKAHLFFLGITDVLQSGLPLRSKGEWTEATVRDEFTSAGVPFDDDDVTQMLRNLS